MPTSDWRQRAHVRDRAAREDRDDLGQDPEHGHERGIGERLPEEPDQPGLHVLVAREEEVERARPPPLEQDRARARPRRAERARSSPTTTRTPTRRTSACSTTSIPSARSERTVATRFAADIVSETASSKQADQPEAGAVALLGDRAAAGTRSSRPSRSRRMRRRRARRRRRRRRRARARPRRGPASRSAWRRSSAARGTSRGPTTTGTRTKKTSSVPCIVSTPL